MEKVKVLTVRQPFAWLIVAGHKTVEYRTWDTPHRGPLLIHAATRFSLRDDDLALELFPHVDIPDVIMTGAILGMVNVVRTTRANGRYEWHLAEARLAPSPFPIGGRLGLWSVDAATVKALGF